MRTGNALPTVGAHTSFGDALVRMSQGGMGMVVIVDDTSKPLGVFTDGDLRRALARDGDLRSSDLSDIMTRNPRQIGADALAAEAAQLMESHRISQLLVTDIDGTLVGALNMHDLMQAKVI